MLIPLFRLSHCLRFSAGQNLILANLSPAPVSHWQSLQLESFGVLLPMSSAPCVLALDNASARACEKCVATLLSSHVRAGPCASCKAFTSLPVAFRSRFCSFLRCLLFCLMSGLAFLHQYATFMCQCVVSTQDPVSMHVCMPSALRSLDTFCPMLCPRSALPSEN